MTPVLVLLAGLTGITAALLFYLASPQQQWRRSGPWPPRHRAWPAGVCAVSSLLLLLQLLAPMEAVFAWCVLLMFGLSLMPFLGAWQARRHDKTHATHGAPP